MDYDNGKHELGEDYMQWLMEHGLEIGKASLEGDKLALNITRIYTIYYARPEHVAAALLEAAIDEYRRRQ